MQIYCLDVGWFKRWHNRYRLHLKSSYWSRKSISQWINSTLESRQEWVITRESLQSGKYLTDQKRSLVLSWNAEQVKEKIEWINKPKHKIKNLS